MPFFLSPVFCLSISEYTLMLTKLYLLVGAGILAVYAVAAWNGWEISTAPRQTLSADVRNSPGGYRSFHFWHSGYRGGK